MIGMNVGQPDSNVYWFYARRSSEKQIESNAQQIEAYEKHFDLPDGAIQRPHTTDTISATKKRIDERPNFSQLLEKMQPGDHLVVWRLDRLGRSFLEMLQTVELIAEKKVWLHSIREYGGQRMDLSSMESKVMVQILMIGHQMYVHYMKQAVQRDIDSKRAAGMAYTPIPRKCHKRVNRKGPRGKWYKVDVWDEFLLARYRFCYDMREAGATWHAIAEKILEQDPPWTYNVGKSVRPWVKVRKAKHFKKYSKFHQYRVEHIMQAVADYGKWLKAEALPGMKNDTDLLTWGAVPSLSAPASEDAEEHSEEPSLPDDSPQ